MNKNLLFSSFILFISTASFSQTKEDVVKIIKNYDVELIKEKINYFKILQENQKIKAIEAANKNGWPLFVKGENGFFQELMSLSPDGLPLYYSTDNEIGRASCRERV